MRRHGERRVRAEAFPDCALSHRDVAIKRAAIPVESSRNGELPAVAAADLAVGRHRGVFG